MQQQKSFIEQLIKHLNRRGFEPRTLGVTDYDADAPLTAIRRLLLESNGLLCVAFRRSIVNDGIVKPKSDIGEQETKLSGKRAYWTKEF